MGYLPIRMGINFMFIKVKVILFRCCGKLKLITFINYNLLFMNDTFTYTASTLSTEELKARIEDRPNYLPETVEAAIAELKNRDACLIMTIKIILLLTRLLHTYTHAGPLTFLPFFLEHCLALY